MKKHVIIMVGVPRSGKSTWCDKFVEKHGEDKVKVLSYDTLRERLYGNKNNQGDFKVIKEVFDYALVKAMNDDDIEYILIDNTNVKKKYRQDLVEFIKSIGGCDCDIVFNELKTSKILVYWRAIVSKFPLKVIRRMYKNYEKIDFDDLSSIFDIWW